MVAAILGFFALVFLSYPALGIIFLICLLSEHNEHQGASIFFEGILLIIIYNMFFIPTHYLIYFAVLYIPIGFAWSFCRWFRYCRDIIEEANTTKAMWDINRVDFRVREYKNKMDIKREYSRVICWILVWPISMIEMLFGDLYEILKIAVKDVCCKAYTRISKRYTEQIDRMSKL